MKIRSRPLKKPEVDLEIPEIDGVPIVTQEELDAIANIEINLEDLYYTEDWVIQGSQNP